MKTRIRKPKFIEAASLKNIRISGIRSPKSTSHIELMGRELWESGSMVLSNASTGSANVAIVLQGIRKKSRWNQEWDREVK